MPNPFTTPIGPEGTATCNRFHWGVEPDTTPVELMCSMLGGALQAQLEEQADDHLALMLALCGDDELTVTVITALFEGLAADVGKAIDVAMDAWLPDPDVMVRVATLPTRIEPSPLALYRTRIMDAIACTGDEPNPDSNASGHGVQSFTVVTPEGATETWTFNNVEGEWEQTDPPADVEFMLDPFAPPWDGSAPLQ